MENYLMSSPTQLSHAFLPSDNAKPMDEQYAYFQQASVKNEDDRDDRGNDRTFNDFKSDKDCLRNDAFKNDGHRNDTFGEPTSLAKEGRLSPSVYEDLDFALDLPDFSYDQTLSLDLEEDRLAPHAMIGKTSHSKTFSFDGALQTPFSLNSGLKFSNFLHLRNVSLDDSNYSRSDAPGNGYYSAYSSGHSHLVSLTSNSADPPSGTFSHSISNSTLQSIDSVPQLSLLMSNKSLQESPYSMVNVHPNTASTPGRRRLLTSLLSSNLYATPLRGLNMHSPTVKVGKTPLKSHHARSRSKALIEAGSSQLLALIANMKNLSVPINLSAPTLAASQKMPTHYNMPHLAPINNTDASNPFENSFVSPRIDMSLSDLDATPLATPAKSFSGHHMQNFTPIPHNQSFGGSLNDSNLVRLGAALRLNSSNDTYRPEGNFYDKERKIDNIKIEEQDNDACKQLKRAKSFVGTDQLRAPLTRAASMRNLKATPYQSASIDLLLPEVVGQDRSEYRTALKSYPASIDLAAITKLQYYHQPSSNEQNYSSQSFPNLLLEKNEYDTQDSMDRLLPAVPANSRRNRSRKLLLSNVKAYPTHLQIQETSTTEEIAKFAEKIMNLDQKRPIIVQADSGEMHDPKKKHKCPLCLARFQRPEHVKRHLKCHSSEKPFQCDIDDCGRRFNRKDNLKAHLKKIHGKVV